MVKRPLRLALTLVLPLAGCELTDITIPAMEPILVVSSVLNTAKSEQFVIVENSQSGSDIIDVVGGNPLPDYPPPSPVSDATVTLTHLSPGADCAEPTVLLEELPPYDDGFNILGSGRYVTSDLCTLEANDVVALEVRSLDGRVVRGRTRIPGTQHVGVGMTSNPAGLTDTLRFHRLNDSLWIDVEPISARGLQAEVVRADHRRTERQDGTFSTYDFPYRTITDTMDLMLPGNTLVLHGNDGVPLFRAGLFHALTVAVTDTNYFDFTRSGSDDFTGRGFINHLEGGIGVFGSVSPVTPIVRVTSDFTDPREGVYRITGTIDNQPVDVTWEIYLDPSDDFLQSQENVEPFFAIVEGIWVGREIVTTAEGSFGGNPFFPFGQYPLSASFLAGSPPDTMRYFVGGAPQQGPGGFVVSVFHKDETTSELVATKVDRMSNDE